MFKFYKKKFLKIDEYDTDNWSVTEMKLPEKTLLRVNQGLVSAAGHPEYPIKMGIAVPVESLSEEVNRLKSEIESKFVQFLQKNSNGILATSITRMEGDLFFELLAYVKEGIIDFQDFHKSLQDKFEAYEVGMYAEYDEEWSTYRDFLKKVKIDM